MEPRSHRRGRYDNAADRRIGGVAVLPAEIGNGRRFATGDARSLNEAEALNLVHPLVRAAIADARRWPGGSVALRLPEDASADLAALAGSGGVMRVVLVDYDVSGRLARNTQSLRKRREYVLTIAVKTTGHF